MTLSELEQINGKPFKVSGFNDEHVATLTDWNGGGLAAPPGGCKVGISLRAVSAAGLLALPANSAFTSSDATMRTANPKVSEILIAY
jgi:hypothetical protein